MLTKTEFRHLPQDILALILNNLPLFAILKLNALDKKSNQFFKSNAIWDTLFEHDFYFEHQSKSNEVESIRRYQQLFERSLMQYYLCDWGEAFYFAAKRNAYQDIVTLLADSPKNIHDQLMKDQHKKNDTTFTLYQILSHYASEEIKSCIFDRLKLQQTNDFDLIHAGISLNQDYTKITPFFEKLDLNRSEISVTHYTRWLIDAARYNNRSMVDYLLYIGVSVNALATVRYFQIVEFYSPLQAACISGHTKLVTHLLTQGATIDLRNSVHATTPLYEACKYGQRAIIELLLEKGAILSASTNASGRDSEITILVKNGYKACLEIVLNHLKTNPNFSLKAPYLDELLDLAILNNHPATTRIICQNGAKITPKHLQIAIDKNQLELLEVLFEFGVSLQSIEQFSLENALWSAAKEGHLNMLTYFCTLINDINTVNIENKTPLYWAVDGGHFQIVRHLLAQGATCKLEDYLLHIACEKGFLKIAKLLLEKNPSWIEETNRVGETPLLAALRIKNSNNLQTILFLIEKGAVVNIATKSFVTPLHRAAALNKIDCATLLLEHGGNPCSRDQYNKTPGAFATNPTLQAFLFGHAIEWRAKSASSLGLFGQKRGSSVEEDESSASFQLGVSV